jgi:endoglucanase
MSASAAADADPGDANSPHNLVANGTFEGGVSLPWTTSFTAPAAGDAQVLDGAFCLAVTHAGVNRWDAQLRIREMVIERGHSYRVRFRAWADKPTRVRPKVGMAGPPYAEYWADTVQLSTQPQLFSAEFTLGRPEDPTAEFAFHAGAELAAAVPFRFCIDDVVIHDPGFTRKQSSAGVPVPNLLVNQLGYLPQLQKLATLKSAEQTPLAWQLLDASSRVVSEGNTRVYGPDPASGEQLQIIDFSPYEQPGAGYRLRVGDQESHTFAISGELYDKLRYDALAFFYHQRSGIPITLPFAGDKRWTRPAGHLGDRSVPCAPNSGCNYELDVSGGWYDAGDHGKYVVNGGISAWTLLNLYERSAQSQTAQAFADGRMNIPEAGNRVPDLLDEARWEVEFLIKMQVPVGKPLAGMVHHKMHDRRWTELGVAPHEDKEPRVLMAPSTAATLNLAAVAAQAARLYETFDAAFSKRCLAAARRAFDAALAHPALYASDANSSGGGPYGDRDVRDEFYWAAAELLITSGEARYKQLLERSLQTLAADNSTRAADHDGTLSWQHVALAGTISLALGPATLAEERSRARAEIARRADALVELRAHEGFALPFAAGSDKSYPWGSNSFVLNNALLLGLAHEFTGERRYLDGVVSTMNYLLGDNPIDQSYVTGYGTRPLHNPHHRFFAHQARKDRPEPPPGIVSGGPNSALQDPYARGAGLAGQPPQKCFLDHIESFSTNEVTINWNAPLAWVVAYVDEQAHKTAAAGSAR